MSDPKARYAKANDIVAEALEADGEARQAIIERRCGDDIELRAEVEWMLQAASSDDRFLEDDAISSQQPGQDSVVHIQTPRNYRIVIDVVRLAEHPVDVNVLHPDVFHGCLAPIGGLKARMRKRRPDSVSGKV